MTAIYPRHAFGVALGDPQPTLLAAMSKFFRRVLRMPWRRRAVPAELRTAADLRTAGAATPPGFPCCVHCEDGSPCEPRDSHLSPCSDGCNGVLAGRMLSEVRTEWNAWHDALTDREVAALRPPKTLARQDGEVLIDERGHVTVRPVNGRYLGDLPRRTPAATLNRAPWKTGSFAVPVDVTLVPVYGEVPVAEVLEAERLAKVMRP